ncbi:hypothetical protein F7725_029075 [Dissostichus mawsoni]|uniref:Uncharacterized protein n=1 Tax=Dissostichus mawsoni TaxID=36200 RepID=A0A7J5XIU9_DISMA|nr:hypothetical protein F7725_029075 [Dissostichus mawsoni]
MKEGVGDGGGGVPHRRDPRHRLNPGKELKDRGCSSCYSCPLCAINSLPDVSPPPSIFSASSLHPCGAASSPDVRACDRSKHCCGDCFKKVLYSGCAIPYTPPTMHHNGHQVVQPLGIGGVPGGVEEAELQGKTTR